MKLTIILLTLCSVTTFGQTVQINDVGQQIKGNSDSTKRIEFLKDVFSAFKSKNFEKYAALFATNEEFKIISAFSSEPIKNTDSLRRTEIELRRHEFKKLLNDAQKENLHWESAEFVDYLIRSYLPNNYPETILIGHLNIRSKSGNIIIFGIQAMEIKSKLRLLRVNKILPGRMTKFIDPDTFEF
jgi:hypothetical protein